MLKNLLVSVYLIYGNFLISRTEMLTWDLANKR